MSSLARTPFLSYNGVWTIDHDDGSQFFNDTTNVRWPFLLLASTRTVLCSTYVPPITSP